MRRRKAPSPHVLTRAPSYRVAEGLAAQGFQGHSGPSLLGPLPMVTPISEFFPSRWGAAGSRVPGTQLQPCCSLSVSHVSHPPAGWLR